MPRYAVFLTSLPGDRLTRAAASWLGRDAFSGAAVPPAADLGLEPAEIAALTHTARLYGFHGTLKAPFHLAEGVSEDDFVAAFEAFCATAPRLAFPPLALGSMSEFLALLPTGPVPELNALADTVVEHFDRFRRPPSHAEIERRNVPSLSDAERRNLWDWGYPYVKDQFRYHMTLTRRVHEGEAEAVRRALDACFPPDIIADACAALAVFRQQEPEGPFVVRAWHPIDARQTLQMA